MTGINPFIFFSMREEVQEILRGENRLEKAAKIDKIGGKPKDNEVH